MFGYVKPVYPELLVKEHEFYKATYCGICRSMRRHLGELSCASITYDSVFLALVRMAYIEDSELGSGMHRCLVHPMKKRLMLDENPAIEYTARAFAILTYYKMKDDLTDEDFGRKMLVNLTRPVLSSAKKQANMPALAQTVRDKLEKITALEKARVASVDEPAQLFGELLGEIFRAGLEGDAALVTYQCGFHLGKFVYAADAAEDYDEDINRGRYNPYAELYGGAPLTDENRASIKCALILECKGLEAAINLVPFGRKHTVENIVRNIIYLGLVKRIDFLDTPRGEDKKGKDQ